MKCKPFVSILLVIILIILFSFFRFLNENHNNRESSKEGKTIKKITTDFEPKNVNLYQIKSYNFGEKFCILKTKYNEIDVVWGCSEEKEIPYTAKESSYFGFSGPILIYCDKFEEKSQLTVETDYGEFNYQFSKVHSAYVVDDTPPVDKNGKKLIDFNSKSKDCYIYNQRTKLLYQYTFMDGTKIEVK